MQACGCRIASSKPVGQLEFVENTDFANESLRNPLYSPNPTQQAATIHEGTPAGAGWRQCGSEWLPDGRISRQS